MKLGDLAEIRSGLILNRKKASIKYEVEKVYGLVSLKNIEETGRFDREDIESFESREELATRYFTREGDILIRLSAPYTAVYIDKDIEGLLVPSSFAIISPNTEKYLPEYIAWYLNSDRVKRELTRSQTGTAMATTNHTILSSINLREIPLEKQKAVVKVRALYLKERELLNQLIEEKEKLHKGITERLIKGK